MSKDTNGFEKSPLQSKKFVAFVVTEVTWKILLAMMILYDVSILAQMTVIIIGGFIEAGYIVGQASLDKYVRVAQITGQVIGKALTKPVNNGTVQNEEPPGPSAMGPLEDEEDLP